MKQRTVRVARYIASLAVGAAHMGLALWAGSTAGGWSWQHGYALPYDTSSSAAISAAIVLGLAAAGAVLVLPEPWMTEVRFLVRGRPLRPCPGCGGRISTSANNDPNTTSKETAK
ncbi:hypothetical protein [Streptomyces rubiginosohelvolus]|uniref:Integral membrane protein n=1 Tax=Streptomyces rubiginosohelvolus TaxID=67362 RepID=A0ABQ3CBG6_9ACTN|nr:hypothetical protein [Streptomyces pluricolorescens]GGZ83498.1 hypothetical protein GCM10010328_67240 [Streptomyces pluricolorescens]